MLACSPRGLRRRLFQRNALDVHHVANGGGALKEIEADLMDITRPEGAVRKIGLQGVVLAVCRDGVAEIGLPGGVMVLSRAEEQAEFVGIRRVSGGNHIFYLHGLIGVGGKRIRVSSSPAAELRAITPPSTPP